MVVSIRTLPLVHHLSPTATFLSDKEEPPIGDPVKVKTERSCPYTSDFKLATTPNNLSRCQCMIS
ncbi:hypothetical protein BKP37_15325 [Anaerobacillus alkalilacustris]|uniref:Uncharacterized protein n=1 Tax=Anaerobacillus alkalilacustris TaxID=393763 RepID=A0A1S2LJD6_9BACI|nr:hypothetical protein [Anaerobacillus alkalilacustris]OIJ11807.1 hypothetical protein BKP37_15325 [Anaerobacillus alkalilacustris]